MNGKGKSLVALFILLLALQTKAQTIHLPLPSVLRNEYRPIGYVNHSGYRFPLKQANPLTEFSWPADIQVGSTFYDLQSKCSSPQSRMVIFLDGTYSTVWTYGMDTVAFTDQGTAYSYFDGSVWTPYPLSRVEGIRTISPCIAMLGSGEVIVSSRPTGGQLHMCKRTEKGTGTWEESDLTLPVGCDKLSYSTMVTGGLGHTVLHILSLTTPVTEGGSTYHGQDGAIVYQRSPDGGSSWQINGFVSSEMDSSHYNGFSPGTFALAEPQGDKLAFVVGDPWSDLFLMKSTDNGNTWEKTLIWEHPYPHWNGEATDSIYCPDGAVHLAFDETGKVHVVFGLTRLFSDGSQVYRFPYIGGIAHWAEGMPVWTGGDQLNCLNPDSLDAEGCLACPFAIDWNGNGTLDLLGNFGDYNCGPTSFPQIAFDEYGTGLLVMSSVTEMFNNGNRDFRHIWYKYLYQGQLGGIVFDYNQDLHAFRENVYPSLATHSPDLFAWPFLYQQDSLPGIAMFGNDQPYTFNCMNKGEMVYMLPPPFVTISLFADPLEGGTVEGAGPAFNGDYITIAAHVLPGYEFVDWTSQGVLFSNDSIYTFQVTSNYSLVAHFRLKTGLQENENLEFAIAPNPAHEYLQFNIPGGFSSQFFSAELTRMDGVLLESWKGIFTTVTKLDISGISPGIYLFEVKTNTGKSFKSKLVIL
ncbi:MAG: T9SS type A sorting domain-containing protein [Bacteroidetes bacterium]|nr:T9SS type A sorting domain-containing protein [Bacteroidota bacterium]